MFFLKLRNSSRLRGGAVGGESQVGSLKFFFVFNEKGEIAMRGCLSHIPPGDLARNPGSRHVS